MGIDLLVAKAGEIGRPRAAGHHAVTTAVTQALDHLGNHPRLSGLRIPPLDFLDSPERTGFYASVTVATQAGVDVRDQRLHLQEVVAKEAQRLG